MEELAGNTTLIFICYGTEEDSKGKSAFLLIIATTLSLLIIAATLSDARSSSELEIKMEKR
jgi:hypothetical protein